VAVAVAGLIAGGLLQGRRALSAARLPPVPQASMQPAAVGDHLGAADRVARRSPTSPSAVGALCVAYHADLFYEEADRCYRIAEDLDRSDWRWMYYRAIVRGVRGRNDGLLEGMRRVVEMAPEVAPAWWRLGEAALKEGRYDEAETAWQRVLALGEPPRPATGDGPERSVSVELADYAEMGLARIALLRGDVQEIRRRLEALTAKTPGFGPAFRLLGDVYARLGLPEDAARMLRAADRLPPYAPYADPMIDALARESRNSTFLLQQVGIARLGGDADWSEYLLRRAREVDPENPDVVLALGQLLRGRGDHAAALELFRRHQAMVPEDFHALAEVGGVLIDLGRFAEAESVLREALEHVDDADTHYNLGVVLASVGRLSEAVATLERAIQRDPRRTDVRMNLAVALIRQGALDEAGDHLQRLLELDPEDDAAHTNLGLVLARQGRFERAMREFRAALRINPSQPQARQALGELSALVP
jgi:tetratricopeptide (TPR) repeat protein